MSKIGVPADLLNQRSAIRESLLTWSKTNFRDLPWRTCREPYPILVAEILLKRTTATASARIYGDFLSKYPTLHHLGKASEFTLIEDLRPLGLHHQRAKAIVKLASYLESEEGGAIPNSLEGLLRVPGLGNYAARAILSFGYGHPYAVVDSNVERVFRRVFQNRLPDRPAVTKFQAIADSLVPKARHREFNFALLDLTWAICRPSTPKCRLCPLDAVCDYSRFGARLKESELREIRKTEGLSLLKLSQMAGISKAALISIEKGRVKPSMRSLEALFNALGSIDPTTKT